ncbi:MAG: bifunctional oligoribonuclease/PAP phosphatase NrnA [Elusimicrobiota bacterium]|nr:bifunctional oligoribonuclease/PAP phosphatase NrnA [Elusimicrobiota bacterium]
MDRSITETAAALGTLKNVLITGHAGPDGDSIGSGQALASFLRRLGIRATVCQSGDIPRELAFLGITGIKRPERPSLTGRDAIIFLECCLPERSGFTFTKDELGELEVFNIDHHPDNRNYGDYNIVDPGVSSVAEIIYQFFVLKRLPLLKNEAAALLTGIVTDTGRFSQKNTTPECLEIASKLVRAGADISKIYNHIYGSQKPARIKLLAETLGTIEILKGSVACMHTDRKMLERCGAVYNDTKDFINYARDLDGVEAACYIREGEDKKIHINFRSLGKNILPFAKKFGGGGHKLASGVTVSGDYDKLRATITRDFAAYVRAGK